MDHQCALKLAWTGTGKTLYTKPDQIWIKSLRVSQAHALKEQIIHEENLTLCAIQPEWLVSHIF